MLCHLDDHGVFCTARLVATTRFTAERFAFTEAVHGDVFVAVVLEDLDEASADQISTVWTTLHVLQHVNVVDHVREQDWCNYFASMFVFKRHQNVFHPHISVAPVSLAYSSARANALFVVK
ncbi:hypothetical protein D3C71_1787470 [compost metagenome]